MAMADDEERGESGWGSAGQGMSTITFILVLAALTLVAAALGFFGGLQVLSSAEHALHVKSAAAQAEGGIAADIDAANLKVLAPVVTNLSDGRDVWIRLESSLLFRDAVPEDADALATRIGEDLVAFLRTVSVKQIEGASGFQHLCEDLNDRVRVRSKGRVQELIIQGLIVE
jgi:flagellar FliL protein